MNLNLPAKRYIHPALKELKTAVNEVKPYRLVSKQTGIKLSEYKGSTLNIIPFDEYLELDGITVDEVIVQSAKNPEIKKIITTFRNPFKSIVERIIENTTPDSKLRNRLYKKDCCTKRDGKEFFIKRVVQEYTLPKNKIQEYKQRLSGIADPAEIKDIYWNHEYTITNILELNHQTLQKLLTTIKTVFQKEKNLDIHSIKESAPLKAVNGKLKIAKNTRPKFLEMVTSQNDNGETTIKSFTKSPSVSDSILNDEYLPFRLYEATDVRKAITKFFIKKNNLDDVGIHVIPNRSRMGISAANFNSLNGDISFSNKLSVIDWRNKTDFVNDAAHEVEHARQHSLIGRLVGEEAFTGTYYNRCFEKKGQIKDTPSFLEAREYLIDMSLTRQYDFSNPAVFNQYSDIYYNSVLEKGARLAGEAAKQDYTAQGQNFAEEFSHIPPKWML